MASTNSKLQIQTSLVFAITRANKFLRHISNRRSLYLVLAAILFCWNSSILWFTHQTLDLQIFNLLLWLGVFITLEDQLHNLWPKPSPASFIFGSLVLAFLLSLSPWLINEQDGYIKYLIFPVILVALALLSRPAGNWQLFKKPLLISLLLPLSGAIEILTSPILNRLTALLTWVFLYGLGFQSSLSGKQILLSSGGVTVETPCNGVEQLVFSMSMIVIFHFVFPLDNRSNLLKALIGAILTAVLINVLRITLLAYLTTWPNKSGIPAFDFFHGTGGLLFSLVAAFLAGWIYLTLLDRELAA
ncbi:archaeosortase/exosortase family protein [Cyanobium sp. AMD-g]|uniref:archaeosortase/exosortase family protein n=1 Tax=Cyanobium sp. AMD-g TaxID=2823699 RepID=UPI0020CE0AE0|nr:archaeosortase/exosortase family protein [Cyanobium sp. AMD-g]MCP9929798.1 archaeosortase/exosortase family protein [Cyanobium sp. AMD-g]